MSLPLAVTDLAVMASDDPNAPGRYLLGLILLVWLLAQGTGR
jgi:hypothetical protein